MVMMVVVVVGEGEGEGGGGGGGGGCGCWCEAEGEEAAGTYIYQLSHVTCESSFAIVRLHSCVCIRAFCNCVMYVCNLTRESTFTPSRFTSTLSVADIGCRCPIAVDDGPARSEVFHLSQRYISQETQPKSLILPHSISFVAEM